MPATSLPPSPELRDRVIRFAVSDAEHTALLTEATLAGMPLAGYLRTLIDVARSQQPTQRR